MVARKKIVRVGAALAALGATASIGLVGNSPAQADPQQYNSPLVGFGSDTTSEVLNAFAGYALGAYFEPLHVGAGDTQLISYNAINPATGLDNSCIAPRVGSPVIHRPNGSGEGRALLAGAFTSPSAHTWGLPAVAGPPASPADPCGQKNPSGTISFARSSSGISASTAAPAVNVFVPPVINPGPPQTLTVNTPFVNLPFARDALAWAYSKPAGGAAPVTTLSLAQLYSLWSQGPQRINNADGVPVLVVPCDINSTSGTRGDWKSKVETGSSVIAAADYDASTAACRLAATAHSNAQGQIEENHGDFLQEKATAVGGTSHATCDGVLPHGTTPVSCAGAQVIIGFAASAYIAKANHPASVGVNGDAQLGRITAGGGRSDAPYTIQPDGPDDNTLPDYTPNGNYYYLGQGATNLGMGRNVANVLPVSLAFSIGNNTNGPLKAMFRNVSGAGAANADGDGTAEICEAHVIPALHEFGFLELSNAFDAGFTTQCGSETQGWDFPSDAQWLNLPARDW